MLPPLPRCSGWAYSSLISPSRVSLPRKGRRVGLHIDLFEACSAFTRVAACTLARSPIRDRYPKASAISSASMTAPVASGWSELPGGPCTHWKAPPCHGAPPYRPFAVPVGTGSVGWIPALGTRGFHRPLSDPSTDLQVRCHGSERDGQRRTTSRNAQHCVGEAFGQACKTYPANGAL